MCAVADQRIVTPRHDHMSKRGNPNWHKGMESPNRNGRPRVDSADPRLQPPVALSAVEQNHARWLELAYKSDGWYNVLTGHGTAAKDKRLAAEFCTDVITEEEGRELWRGDPLGARIVEAVVNEMLREPMRLCIPDDAEGNDEEYGKELVEKVEGRWKFLQVVPVLHEALCMKRALGGSVVLLGADDGALSLEEPLNAGRIKSFEWLTVLEPREVTPVQWYTDARAPKFGQVEIYQLTPIITGVGRPGAQLATQMVRVHESRLLVFKGPRVSRVNQWGQRNSFGDSVFTRIWPVLRDFNAACSGAGILVHDFAQPVFKIKGLADIIAKDNKQLFQARMQALALAMSTARAALIDSEEEYARQQTPVTGLAELLDFFCKLLAAVADTPVSVIFSEAPGGLNASGASGDQLSLWYNRVRALQTQELEPAVRKITELIMATMGGEPDQWRIEFDPLWHPSDKEQAETDKVETDNVCALWDRGILSTEEIRRNPRFVKKFGVIVEDQPLDVTTDPVTGKPVMADPAATQAPADPNAVPLAAGAPVDPNAATGTDLAKEAFNGAQVTALIEVVTAVATKQISRQSAQKMLELAFQLSPVEAAALLGPEDFEPEKAAPSPSPFGGGGAPFGAKPAEQAPPADPIGKKPDNTSPADPIGKDAAPADPKAQA